jgi:hypothetical protein
LGVGRQPGYRQSGRVNTSLVSQSTTPIDSQCHASHHGDANIYIDTYPYGHFDQLSDGYLYSNYVTKRDADQHADTHTHSYADSNFDADRDGDSCADHDFDEYSVADATGDQHTDPDTHTGQRCSVGRF